MSAATDAAAADRAANAAANRAMELLAADALSAMQMPNVLLLMQTSTCKMQMLLRRCSQRWRLDGLSSQLWMKTTRAARRGTRGSKGSPRLAMRSGPS